MNLVFIRKPIDFLKIPLGAIIIAFLALSPALISILAGTLDHSLNESNSALASLGWLCLLTLPIGAIILVLWIILSIYNGIVYFRNSNRVIKR